MKSIITEIRQALIHSADEHTRTSGQRFFKEEVKLYGVRTAQVSQIGKAYARKIKDLDKQEVFALCKALWESGYLEETFIACQWAYAMHARFEPEDFRVFEKWVTRYVNNWASCDTLCNHTIGTFIEMYPGYLQNLKEWAGSGNRWTRRAAAVSLIIPARRGKFLEDIFSIADILLMDTDDLVRKGYGWMLKSASQAHQQEVFAYVMRHKDAMPRTALRYAIEKMPGDLKARAMEKQ
jgi:3-methyladenine DNA glycosylase AlkD